MNLYLIGYMCSGKTTLGNLLSSITGKNFIDLDQYIEKKYSDTINGIFAKYGEVTFREIERDALKSISEKSDSIIATGGGTPCFFDNMEFMNKNGVTIYLQCSNEELLNRLKIYKSTRPLLKDKNDKELAEYIENTLPARDNFYTQASIIINADPLSDENLAIGLAKEIVKVLKI